MNITMKTILALGAAGLSLLALAGGASAQTTIGDPSLTTDFSTVTAGGDATSYTGAAIGVGYDANGGGGKLPNSGSQATAQSVYEAFVFDSSAAGQFTTISAGSTAQVQVFANENNVAPNASTFDIYTSLYAYNPNAAAGTVPVLGPNLFGTPQKVVLGAGTGGYFSSDFTLPSSIVAGQSYVFGVTTLNNDTQDFANIASSVFSNGQTPSADQGFDRVKYITTDDDQGAPTSYTTSKTTNNVLSFSIAAGAASPAPEPSQWAGMAFTGLGIALLAAKRRRSVVSK